MMRLDKLLSNLGYGSRKQVRKMLKAGQIEVEGCPTPKPETQVEAHQVRIEGEPLDPPPGLVIMLNKPAGFSCSHSDRPPLIYDLLPPRFHLRKPKISSVGRLDKDTTGLLLLTDDGPLLHRLTSPRYKVEKVYQVEVEQPLDQHDLELFAAGGMMLDDDPKPLLPVRVELKSPTHLEMGLHEGRTHQVKLMIKAVGNRVTRLHRSNFGNLTLGHLEEGEFRFLDETELENLRNSSE